MMIHLVADDISSSGYCTRASNKISSEMIQKQSPFTLYCSMIFCYTEVFGAYDSLLEYHIINNLQPSIHSTMKISKTACLKYIVQRMTYTSCLLILRRKTSCSLERKNMGNYLRILFSIVNISHLIKFIIHEFLLSSFDSQTFHFPH